MNKHTGSKVVIATVGLLILAGLLSGAATLWHTRNISREYDQAIKKELEQKGLAYAYTATIFLDAVGPDALTALTDAATLGAQKSEGVEGGDRESVGPGNFANTFLGVEVWQPDAKAKQKYQSIYTMDLGQRGPGPRSVDSKQTTFRLITQADANNAPAASVVEDDERLLVAFPLDLGVQRVIVVGTLSAHEEFSFFAAQRKDVFLQGMIISGLIIAVASAIGIGVSAFVARDLTSRRRVEETLREQARRDLLTGTLNHAAIVNELRQLIATGGRSSHAIAMIDVDGLKALNDNFGHQFGDTALVAVAHALAEDGVIVGRYGGDEFVAVLLGADRNAAEQYRQRVTVRFAIAEVRDPETGAPVPVTASIGLAVFPDDARTITELIAVSDGAMYAAKRQRPGHRPPETRAVA